MSGRPALYDDRGITPSQVIDWYHEGKGLDGGAKLAGVSRKTFWTWTRRAKMTLERGRPPLNRHHRGSLATWIRENPDTHLPISPIKIASLTGSTIDAVKSYLKRRRHEMISWVRRLPDLRSIRGVSLLTTEGYALPLIAIRGYTISVPRLKVRIHGMLRSGKVFTISTTQGDLEKAIASCIPRNLG